MKIAISRTQRNGTKFDAFCYSKTRFWLVGTGTHLTPFPSFAFCTTRSILQMDFNFFLAFAYSREIHGFLRTQSDCLTVFFCTRTIFNYGRWLSSSSSINHWIWSTYLWFLMPSKILLLQNFAPKKKSFFMFHRRPGGAYVWFSCCFSMKFGSFPAHNYGTHSNPPNDCDSVNIFDRFTHLF